MVSVQLLAQLVRCNQPSNTSSEDHRRCPGHGPSSLLNLSLNTCFSSVCRGSRLLFPQKSCKPRLKLVQIDFAPDVTVLQEVHQRFLILLFRQLASSVALAQGLPRRRFSASEPDTTATPNYKRDNREQEHQQEHHHGSR